MFNLIKIKKMMKKELYLAPETEVLVVRLEGVIAASEIDPNLGDPGLGGMN